MISERPFLAAVAIVIATAVPHPVPAGTTSSDRQAQDHVVIIEKFEFATNAQSILPGDTVVWINNDIVPHTATASDGSWDTGSIAPGERRSIRITDGFSTDYFCRFHPMMRSRLAIPEGH